MSNPMKVLLVDDEEEFVSTLAERLEIRGFVTEVATSGDMAISAVQDKNFDIVVLDLMMPGIGGLDVMEKIKSMHPDMPIILLTGHGSAKEKMERLEMGALDYLMKPLDIDELILKIGEASPKK